MYTVSFTVANAHWPMRVLCAQDAWLGVYDAAVEAIFLCYLVDQEENDGEARPYYASTSLRSYMERHRPCYQLPEASPAPDSKKSENVA